MIVALDAGASQPEAGKPRLSLIEGVSYFQIVRWLFVAGGFNDTRDTSYYFIWN